MKRKRIVAVDLDDVLFDFLGHFFAWHNQEFASNFSPKDMVFKTLWEVWGGTREEAAERIEGFWRDIDMLEMEPIAGSRHAMAEIKKHFRLLIISARSPDTAEITEQWLKRYFPGIFEDISLGVSDPMSLKKPLTKAQQCKAVGAEILIDDQLVHAIEGAEEGIQVYLFGDQAHNQSDELPNGVVRVSGWKALQEILVP